jgi:D-xylose transport system substrate-binding protein
MRLPSRRTLRTALTALGLTAALGPTGCANGIGLDSAADVTTTGGNRVTGTVAMLLVRSSANRYIAHDQPYFQQRLLELCPRCEVDVRYAEQDADKQAEQVNEVLDRGAKVLVLNAVNAKAAGDLAAKARARGVPVISYDRLISGGPVDYFVSFDNIKSGRMQGEALLQAAKARGGGELLWIDGPAVDANALVFSKGAHEVLDGKIPVAARFQLPGPGWSADQVRTWLRQVLPTLRGRTIVGVLSPIDPMSATVVAELHAAGVTPWPAVTGQDSDIAGLQRVMTGQQVMTVYKPFKLEAEKSAELAYDLLVGKRQTAPTTVDNKAGQVPAFLVEPVLVTRDTIKDTVLKDGFVTRAALCAGQYADACKSLGLA